MPIDPLLIRANGWRQGSVFSAGDSRTLLALPESNARLILVSHDCDIVHAGPREPVVEVCVAEPLQTLDGTFAYGKNPRLLHVELTMGEAAIPHSLQVASRRSIDRSVLERLAPANDAEFDESQSRIVTRWLAKRYDRAALPDHFNQRCRPAVAAIRETLRDDGGSLSGLLMSLNSEDELAVGDSYEVFLVGLIPKARHEVGDERTRSYRAVSRVAAALDACAGIDVVEFELVSEDDFTLHDLHSFIEYACEDLSLEQNGEDPVLPRA